MALGLLLRVSWICFLLFDGSVGLPAMKVYGYPYISDSRNIGVELTSPTFEENNWEASNNQPTSPVYTSYNEPTFWAPSQQNQLKTPSGHQVEKLVNGASRDWGLENLDKPLVFPLLSDPAKPQPGPVQPQSTASTNSKPASPSAGDTTHYASQTAVYDPSSTGQSAMSPSLVSWQPQPDSSGYGVVDYSAAGGNSPSRVFEDIFQYPENAELTQSSDADSNTAGGYSKVNYMSKESSNGYSSQVEEPSFPSYPTNIGAQPIYPSGIGSGPEGVNLNFGQTDYQPHENSWQPQEPVASSVQRVSEPIPPPPPLPSSYIVQSRNGYQRGRYFWANSKYSPELLLPMPGSSKGVKGPAPSQPAAPKGVKNPQRPKW